MPAAGIKQRINEINNREVSRFISKIISDWSLSLSALMAYYLLISLLPFILSMFAVVSVFFADDVSFQAKVRDRLLRTFPEQGLSEVLSSLLTSFGRQASLVFFISFLFALFTASRLFVGIDDVLTVIYRTRERSIVEQNILALRMIIAFVVIMPLIIIFASVPAFLRKQESIYQLFTVLIGGFCEFILFQMIYFIMPNRRTRWRHTWCGALFAAIALQLTLLLFPLYVHQFMVDYVGQLGLIIVTLLLFYTFGLIFVFGAQINAFFFDHIEPLPAGLGTCLSQFADQEQMQLIDVTEVTMKADADEFNQQEHNP